MGVSTPPNFWCSVRRADVALRAAFLAAYAVARINVFEERVFDDTSYAVCAFQFAPRAADSPAAVPITVFPTRLQISAELSARTTSWWAATSTDCPCQGAIDDAAQARLAAAFNSLLNARRARYHSLFMSNFRESKDVARKRISFDLVYRIAEHALDALDGAA